MAKSTQIEGSGPPARAIIRVARRLRELRSDQGLTLRDLAARAGFSEATLSRIENHKVSVPIDALESLAGALNVPLATFFEEDERTVPIAVCRAGRGVKGRTRGAGGFVHEMLSVDKKGKLMEPLIVDIASARHRMAASAHPGEQFNYVLEGEYMLTYGKQTIHLRKGDAVYFDGNVPHASHAIPGKPCRLLVVVSSREYLFHGDISSLLEGVFASDQAKAKKGRYKSSG